MKACVCGGSSKKSCLNSVDCHNKIVIEKKGFGGTPERLELN